MNKVTTIEFVQVGSIVGARGEHQLQGHIAEVLPQTWCLILQKKWKAK